jgi:7-cyano-7-deazaguanine synthase
MSAGLLLSGGIDSSALAFWKRPIVCFTVDYGQLPARAEVTAAKAIAAHLGARHEILSVDCSSLGSGDLTMKPALGLAHAPEWWPFRNQLLVTICAVRAVELGLKELLLGTVTSDSVHGDGTQEFIASLDRTLSCQEGDLHVSAPALTMTSLQLIAIAGIPLETLAGTHSCHTGCLACGRCRGCQRRFAAFQALGIEAPTLPSSCLRLQ